MKKAVISLIIIAGAAFLSLYIMNAPPEVRDQEFTVTHGESIRQVAGNLKKQNLIKSKTMFVFMSYALRRHTIRAGKYKIAPGMTTADIFIKLTRGEILTRKVTIPEGFNLYQIAERLEGQGICDGSSFLGYAGDRVFLKARGIDSPTAEGYLFPDTYRFPEGSDPRDVIMVMQGRMMSVIGSRPAYGPGMSLREILTMASLVEKEARVPSEREFVSSVFHNRLRKNMRLDCDPTVRYAVKKFTGPITLSDLASDSPYNTYRRGGLPPTPICSPGRESIIAAMNPKKSDYLYFVARNDGSHQFSKTLREHNNAVRQYQRRR